MITRPSPYRSALQWLPSALLSLGIGCALPDPKAAEDTATVETDGSVSKDTSESNDTQGSGDGTTDTPDGADGTADATDGTDGTTDGTTDATDGTTDATDGTDGTTDGDPCGECPLGTECDEASAKCVPTCSNSCDGVECGTNDCGVSCGTSCLPGQSCQFNKCIEGPCTATCESEARSCGKSSCGDPCGDCGANEVCSAAGACECVPQCGSKECGPDSCGGSCGECSGGKDCNDAGKCECVPVCANLTCADDGCGGSCGCPLGYDCETGVCEKACAPLCGDGFDCQAGSCVQVAPVVLFNLNMNNVVTPSTYGIAAPNNSSKPLTALVGGQEVVRASMFFNNSGPNQVYGLWGNSKLASQSKELRVGSQDPGSVSMTLTPDIATSIPIDRFEVIMHVARAEMQNSGLNKGSAYFYMFPDKEETTYHRIGLGFENVSGDYQYESVVHVSSGVGKADANAKLTPSIQVSDDFTCPGEVGCAGAGLRIRFQVVGSVFKIKYWSAASPEPSSWTATETWNPPAALHHWAFGLYGSAYSASQVGGAALGSLMIRSLPEGGTDALLGASYPSNQDFPLP